MHALDRLGSRRIKTMTVAFAFWTLLGLSYALSAGLSDLSEGEAANWGRLFTWYLASFWLWIPLVPLIALLGRKTAGKGWWQFCLVHIPSSLAMALTQVLVHVAVFWVLWSSQITTADTFGGYLQREFVFNFYFAQLTYWVVLAVLRGMDFRRHLRDERLRNAQLETQLVQSQLQSLRMQLQPHFLFNTLNAISALALADPMQARLMIARLGDLLRLTLEERHAQQVPLARELEFVRSYLDIQRIRFRDRLETQIDVSDEALHATVPSMILQPLVENALQHGLSGKAARGNLYIAASCEDEHLRLCVEDDGLGLPPGGAPEGVGLGNTRARLDMLFGSAAHVRLSPRAGGGTRVELRFPFMAYVETAAT